MKTGRSTVESWCQWVIDGRIPDAMVKTAARTPMARTI
jgi:hypothetical protein